MPNGKYKGFTLASVHDCKRALPNAAEFHDEHPGRILMCDWCKTKWSVHGSSGNGQRTFWWEPYQGAAE